MLTAKEGALCFARMGFAVFRVVPNGKDPYRKGVNEATTNATVIERWFERDPDINYGVSTNGHAVLDVDPRKDPDGWVAEWLALGPIPKTLQVITPSGGVHVWFAGFEAGQRKLSPCIDVRGRGGYVVGPGSVIDGRRYRVHVAAPPAPVPPSILPRLSKPGEKAENSTIPVAELDTPGAIEYAEAMLKRHPGAVYSERNAKLFLLACALKDKGVSLETNHALLLEHFCPKCDPPYGDFAEIERTVVSAYHNGQKPPGIDAPETQFEDLTGDPDLTEWAKRRTVSAEKAEEIDATAPSEPAGEFVDVDLLQDPATIPRRSWLFHGDILRRHLTGIVAPGGVGKSAFAVNIAIAGALANGDFLRMRFNETEPVNVLLIANEDEYDELRMRIHAACITNGIDPKALHGRIKTYRGASGFLAVVKDEKTRKLTHHPAVKRLVAYSRAANIGLHIFDPLVEMHEGNENDNAEMAKVMRVLRAVVRVTNTGGIVIHHTAKQPAGSANSYVGSADAGRGASAFRANVRRSLTLASPSDDDAARYGLLQHQRSDYVRLDDGKTQYSKKGHEPRWYTLTGVTVPNGESAVALRYVDMAGEEVKRKRALAALLVPRILESGEGMLIKNAVAVCMEDALIAATQGKTVLTRQLRDAFREPFIFEEAQRLFFDAEDDKLYVEAHP